MMEIRDGYNPMINPHIRHHVQKRDGFKSKPCARIPEPHNGNDEPQGFGHICIAVDDLDAACKRFEEKGVSWKKKLTDGRMKNIAFVLDPDG